MRSKGICYLCGTKKLSVIHNKLRHNIKRNVLKCEKCGIVYLEPVRQNLKDYYTGEYRKLYTPVIGRSLNSKELFDICLPYQKNRIDELKHALGPQKKLLDVGCASGAFLHAVKSHVMECVGIEFNSANARFVEEVLGIKVYTKHIEYVDLPHESFDIITAFQVLEHIEDPVKFLVGINNLLKPGGIICIEVPNVQDVLLSVYNVKPYADFWFREPHIFNYSPKTLTMVLKKSGFVGKTKTIQLYNLINHLNWMLKGEPQQSMDIGMSKPVLAPSHNAIADELNRWIAKVDREYKNILNKHELGESILFIGKKVIGKKVIIS
ncbi:MAG: class I SAM-dependent methyltransferase [Elusimicrobiota bacterium]